MNRYFNPDTLIIAREAQGYTQTELAEATSISQATISKYEHGMLAISQEHLQSVADVLDFPLSFFSLVGQRHGFGSNCTYHRKRQTMPVSELKQLHGRINAARFRLNVLLDGANIECENSFPRLDLEEYDGDVERVAQIVRSHWKLPLGPVNNLVAAVENAGGIVIRSAFGTRNLDAVSQLIPALPPLFFVNNELPQDRLRFSLAHEIGHIVMHQFPTPSPKDNEREADRFAAELLMPAKEIAPYLEGLTLQALPKLKSYWKVSMQAIIMRAYHLERVTQRQYRFMFEQFGKLHYRTKEPVSIPVEEPSVLRDIIEMHKTDYNYSNTELGDMLGMHQQDLAALLNVVNENPADPKTPSDTDPTKLRLVS